MKNNPMRVTTSSAVHFSFLDSPWRCGDL